MRFRYCWSLAVDPADPKTIVLSASPSARAAHNRSHAESAIYRRTRGGRWQEIQSGLPESRGVRARVLAASPEEPGVFYAAGDSGVYRSADRGQTWERLNLTWPGQDSDPRIHALSVTRSD